MDQHTIIYNGCCFAPGSAPCGWLELEGTRIKSMGAGDTWSALAGARTRLIDARGGSILPGFIDNHFHLVQTALNSLSVDLSDARSFDDIGAAIQAAGQENPALPIYGIRLDIQNLAEKRLPDRAVLDAIWNDSPVWLNICDYQTSILNTYAMLYYKIPFTQQGVQYGPKSMPTGRFIGQANALLRGNILKKTSDFYRLEALFHLMPQLAEQGVTTIAAVEGGDLYCDRDAEFIQDVITNRRVYPDIELFFQTLNMDLVQEMGLKRVGGCLYVDGTFNTRTAAISFDYADAPRERGVLKFTQAQMDELVEQCYCRGLQLALYTVGDRAIDLVINAHRRAAKLTGNLCLRHRLEHVELPSPQHIQTASELNLIFSMQPSYESSWGGPGKMYEKRLGDRRLDTNPFRKILDGGVTLCGGTDSDVCQANYIQAIHAAVNHPTPEHRITVEEAVTMFTSSGAYALGLEQDRGYLKEGFRGDVIVLDRDILSVPAEQLCELKVMYTLKDGALVYNREGGGFQC